MLKIAFLLRSQLSVLFLLLYWSNISFSNWLLLGFSRSWVFLFYYDVLLCSTLYVHTTWFLLLPESVTWFLSSSSEYSFSSLLILFLSYFLFSFPLEPQINCVSSTIYSMSKISLLCSHLYFTATVWKCSSDKLSSWLILWSCSVSFSCV